MYKNDLTYEELVLIGTTLHKKSRKEKYIKKELESLNYAHNKTSSSIKKRIIEMLIHKSNSYYIQHFNKDTSKYKYEVALKGWKLSMKKGKDILNDLDNTIKNKEQLIQMIKSTLSECRTNIFYCYYKQEKYNIVADKSVIAYTYTEKLIKGVCIGRAIISNNDLIDSYNNLCVIDDKSLLSEMEFYGLEDETLLVQGLFIYSLINTYGSDCNTIKADYNKAVQLLEYALDLVDKNDPLTKSIIKLRSKFKRNFFKVEFIE